MKQREKFCLYTFIFTSILVCILCFACIFVPSTSTLYAAVDRGDEIKESTVDDYNLFQALKRALKYENSAYTQSYLYANSFVKEYYQSIGLYGFNTSEKYNDTEGVLDLSYLVSLSDPDYSDVIDLTGLNYFDFSDVKILDISNLKLSFMGETFLERFTNLERIVAKDMTLSGDNLDAILNGARDKVKYVDFSGGNLSTINLTYLSVKENTSVNLSNNDFSDITDIVTPVQSEGKLNINLIGNNILTADSDTRGENVKFIFGLQMSDNARIQKDSNIKYFSISGLSEFGYSFDTAKVKFLSSSGEVVETFDETGNITMPVGRYTVKYYDESDQEIANFGTITCEFIPNTPEAKIVYNGKEYDTYYEKMTGRPTIRVLNFEGKEIYYRISTGDWQKLADDGIIKINRGGKFNVIIKQVENGVDSDLYIVQLTLSANKYLSDTVIYLILGAVFLFLVFGLVPLLKFFKKRKK